MMRIFAGITLIAAFAILRVMSVKRIFAAWRTADRHAWSEAVRPAARRRMPFRAFLWSRITQRYEFEWMWRTPAWISGSPKARHWLRVYRWSPLLFIAGVITAFSAGL